MPVHRISFWVEWKAKVEECDHHAAQWTQVITSHYKQHACQLPALHIIHPVHIRYPASGLWDKEKVGTVISHGKLRQFHVCLLSGRLLWRNCHPLCLAVFAAEQPEGPVSADDGNQDP